MAVTAWLADADRSLFETVRTHRGRAGTETARIISAFGEPVVVYPGLMAVAAVRRAAGNAHAWRAWW